MQIINSFTCEAILQRNGLSIPIGQGKTKNKLISLHCRKENDQFSISINPFIQISSTNSEEILYQFTVSNIRKIINKFIEEGKLSIEIQEGQFQTYLLISKAIKEKLLLFIQAINQINQIYQQSQGKLQPNLLSALSQSKNQISSICNSKTTSKQVVVSKSCGTLPQGTQLKHKVNREILEESEKQKDGKRKILDNEPGQDKLSSYRLNNSKRCSQESKQMNEIIKSMPDSILIKIISFMNKSQLMELRLVNKEFDSIVWNVLAQVSFLKKGDIPTKILLKLLNKGKYLQRITFGNMKNLTQTDLVVGLQTDFVNLSFLDLSWFSQLTDKMVRKFFANCKKIRTLILPYHSKITNDCLEVMHAYIPIQYLGLKSHRDSFDRNENISDQSIVKCLQKSNSLQELSLHTVGSKFFEALQKSSEESLGLLKKIKTLKLVNIHISKDQLKLLSPISQMPNLQNLKLGNFVEKCTSGLFQYTSTEDYIFKLIFGECKNIERISLGHWANNEILKTISECEENIRKVTLSTENINDKGFEPILLKMEKLEKVNIINCKKIQGNCFEVMISKQFQELKITTDDYSLQCLADIFSQLKLDGVKIKNCKKN